MTDDLPPLRSLALFSAFHPHRMGIADYTEDLASALSRHFEIQGYGAADFVRSRNGMTPVRPHSDYRGREDIALYQVGNSPDLAFLVPYLQHRGGVITLHDATLHDLLYPYFAQHQWRLVVEAFRCLESPARRALMNGAIWRPWSIPQRSFEAYCHHPEKRDLFGFFPLALRKARGVIVHSQFLTGYVRALRPNLPVFVIPHGIRVVDIVSKQECRWYLRNTLGVTVSDETLLAVCFGAIQRRKRLTAVLRAMREFSQEDREVLLLLVGPREPEYDVDAEISALDVGAHIKVLDQYIGMDDVNRCLGGADICFNLRHPSYGSTSGTLHKAMAAGCPVATTCIDGFAEYPDDVVFHVPPPGPGEWERCLDLLRLARRQPELASELGRRARRHAEAHWAWPQVAIQYAKALEQMTPQR